MSQNEINGTTQVQNAVESSAWLDELVFKWRDAEKHWRKRASASDDDPSCYEDGLAEAFGRCADILLNERCKARHGDNLLDALRKIKLTALTTTDAAKGLAHITRLCIDAGIREHLDELCSSNSVISHNSQAKD